MECECCILCREVYPTAVCTQGGQSPVPGCQWEHMSLGQIYTSVSSAQSDHQSDHSTRHCSVITHHLLLGRGQEGQPDGDAAPVTALSITTGMCLKKTKKQQRVRRIGRVSEREGEVKTALSGTERRETLLLPVKD